MNITWQKTDDVAVAVSGGVDSMALLDQVRESAHYNKLIVLHVNHQLREASIDEEEMIKQYCDRYQLTCFIHRIPAGTFSPERSIQHEARNIRYAFFQEVMERVHINILLTAHHLDDQVETILYRFLTNRYIFQSAGMEEVSAHQTFQMHRPLLDTRKSSLIQYCLAHHVPYMNDASNVKNNYSRNRIRNNILPEVDQMDIDRKNMLRFAEYQQEVRHLIMENAASYDASISKGVLNRDELKRENKLVVMEILKQLVNVHVSHYHFSAHLAEEIYDVLISDSVHASFEVTSRWNIQIAYDKLSIQRKRTDKDDILHITSPGTYSFNQYNITVEKLLEPMIVRSRSAGDKIIINDQHQSVSRIMKDQKLPVYDREGYPIITIADEIIRIGNLKQTNHKMNDYISIKKEQENA